MTDHRDLERPPGTKIVTIPAAESDRQWLVIFLVTPRGGVTHRGEKQFAEILGAQTFMEKRPPHTASLWRRCGNNYVHEADR